MQQQRIHADPHTVSTRDNASRGSDRKPEHAIAADITDEVLYILRCLVRDLHLRDDVAVTLDSNLDHDLALDSLSRAELALRLDRAFHRSLPETIVGEAQTPADLIEAILSSRPATRRPPFAIRIQQAVPHAPVRDLAGVSTLTEALWLHAGAHPDREQVLLPQLHQPDEVITYARLDHAARMVAGGLLERGLGAGDRVALMLPTGAAFFFTFFGILYAGGVPVPIYPAGRRSQLEDHLRRQANILSNAQARFLVTDDEVRPLARLVGNLVDSLDDVVTHANVASAEPVTAPVPVKASDIALIQYTSGSTSYPKGVVLSHANLLANIRAMGTAIDASSRDVVVSWLPLYHDMGLIGAWLAPLYFGARSVILSPLAFLSDPKRWLWSLHQYQGTISAAPNFAYELCLKSIRDVDVAGLDLSSVRYLMNGAEPINPSTLVRFAERFAPYGLKPEALAPVYGLAESSVGLAFPPLSRSPIVDRVDRGALMGQGWARPAEPHDRSPLEFAGCGRPLPGHDVRIVDEAGHVVPERREGRLQFRGPSATAGYFRNPEKTRALFAGEWLESGDRAYVADGDVFITGRTKDIIIRAGRNIYPHEVEQVAGSVEGVRSGCVAAFSHKDAGSLTEQLVLIAETRLTRPQDRDRLRHEIVERLQASLALVPDEVVLAPPHSVPKTSSGKIRRSAARALFESGTVGRSGRPLWQQLGGMYLAGLRARLGHMANRGGELLYAARWWGMLGVVSLAVLPLVIVLPRRDWRHAVLSAGARMFFRLAGTRVQIDSGPPLPSAGAVLVANHASYLDGAVLAAGLPGPVTYVAKEELARLPITHLFLRRLGVMFVRRTGSLDDRADLQPILEAVRRGEKVVFFPEGTFTRKTGLRPFRLGAFFIAANAGVPVVPVTIAGTRSMLRAREWIPRREALSVHIGQPLLPEGDDFSAAIRLRDLARQAILARCGEPDLRHGRPRRQRGGVQRDNSVSPAGPLGSCSEHQANAAGPSDHLQSGYGRSGLGEDRHPAHRASGTPGTRSDPC